MRIVPRNINPASEKLNKKKESGKKESLSTDNFLDLFSEEVKRSHAVEGFSESGKLEDLLDMLDEKESRFIDNPNVFNYTEYRDQVKKSAAFLLEKAFQVKNLRDKNNEYKVVTVINEQLKIIYQKILGKNINREEIAELTGTIRGWILDIKV